MDAETASRIGWANSSFSTAEELRNHVDKLALRISSFPRDGIKYTKMGIRENVAGIGSVEKDLGKFKELLGTEVTQHGISQILKHSDDMSLGSFELGLPDSIFEIWEGSGGSKA